MTFFNQELLNQAKYIVELATTLEIKLASAESCTGGLISALITEVSGASSVFECGFATYSNNSKSSLLNIDEKIIEKYGAVSSQTAENMAIGAVKNSKASISIATTGIAGPLGGTRGKPVGLVYIASFDKNNNNLICQKCNFDGDRDKIRLQTVSKAITILINQIQNHLQ